MDAGLEPHILKLFSIVNFWFEGAEHLPIFIQHLQKLMERHYRLAGILQRATRNELVSPGSNQKTIPRASSINLPLGSCALTTVEMVKKSIAHRIIHTTLFQKKLVSRSPKIEFVPHATKTDRRQKSSPIIGTFAQHRNGHTSLGEDSEIEKYKAVYHRFTAS